MKRKFTNITCIYHDDKNYIPARYSCPDLEIDDVLLDLTTNAESNYEKIASMMKDKFAEWIDNGHNDFNDENTCILKIELTHGLLWSNGKRFEITFR